MFDLSAASAVMVSLAGVSIATAHLALPGTAGEGPRHVSAADLTTPLAPGQHRHLRDYLIRKRPYLDYPTALERGWPIATGVIEGACRHLVKDRMDLTGARWGLHGAEAVLKLRALRSNGDFDDYWRYHLAHERQRVHQSRYADNVIPLVA